MSLPTINTYNLCNNTLKPEGNARRGFIISPNYPNTPNRILIVHYNLEILKAHQDIYFYIIDMDLNGPNIIGQSCIKRSIDC